jgi:general secretion pathway protein G
MRGQRTSAHTGGFTLLELMIVVAILAVIAAIGGPNYVSALRTARFGKAKHELKMIANAVDSFRGSNGGQLPLTLHQVGFGGKADPWGVPYCYLNYGDGTGDGLAWAVAAGLVDPSAFRGGGAGGDKGGGGSAGSAGVLPGCIALGPLAWFEPQGMVSHVSAEYTEAKSRAVEIASALGRPLSTSELDALTTSIAGSRGFDLFVGVVVDDTRRRDQFMLPLNTDYDLFSLGADGRTSVSLSHSIAKDDVIRANNGGYFGTAGEY